jgi:hypothetical protein
MGTSESGLAEPHEQEHLAILARGLCSGQKDFAGNGDELGTQGTSSDVPSRRARAKDRCGYPRCPGSSCHEWHWQGHGDPKARK